MGSNAIKTESGLSFPSHIKFHEHYACAGDAKECYVGAFRVDAMIVHDSDYHIDNDDAHNVQALQECGLSKETIEQCKQAREAWERDEWFYCGIVVRVYYKKTLLSQASLWGIECNYPIGNNSYLDCTADELMRKAIPEGVKELHQLIDGARLDLLLIRRDFGIPW